jgi:hypothetical protein
MFVNKKAIDTLIEEILNFNNRHVKAGAQRNIEKKFKA